MARVDAFSSALANHNALALPARSAQPAHRLFTLGLSAYKLPGRSVADALGCLVHYTTPEGIVLINGSGAVGPPGGGVWLTPTPYAACMTPYDLGLPSPRKFALVIDVSTVAELWGPGTAPSTAFPSMWRGGGTEFYVPSRIPLSAIREVIELQPCGDEH